MNIFKFPRTSQNLPEGTDVPLGMRLAISEFWLLFFCFSRLSQSQDLDVRRSAENRKESGHTPMLLT